MPGDGIEPPTRGFSVRFRTFGQVIDTAYKIKKPHFSGVSIFIFVICSTAERVNYAWFLDYS